MNITRTKKTFPATHLRREATKIVALPKAEPSGLGDTFLDSSVAMAAGSVGSYGGAYGGMYLGGVIGDVVTGTVDGLARGGVIGFGLGAVAGLAGGVVVGLYLSKTVGELGERLSPNRPTLGRLTAKASTTALLGAAAVSVWS